MFLTAHGVELFVLHQSIWLFKWQRPQQHCVDDAKNGGVRANSQRQRQNRYAAEPRIFCQHSQTVSEVLPERLHRILPH